MKLLEAEDKHFIIGGQKVEYHKALDPSNIIWDSDGATRNLKYRKWIARAVGALCLLGYFWFLVWLTQTKIEIDYLKSPPGVNCPLLLEQNGPDAAKLAFLEMKTFNDIYKSNIKQIIYDANYGNRIKEFKDGHLTCFCDKQLNQMGKDPLDYYDVFGESHRICHRWHIITGSFASIASNCC